MRVHRLILFILALCFPIVSCGGSLPSEVDVSPETIVSETRPSQPTPVPTSTVVPTKMPEPSPTALPPLDGSLIAFTQFTIWDKVMYLIDVESGIVRHLYYDGGHPVWVQWIDDGCEFYVRVVDQNDERRVESIVRSDLSGGVLETIWALEDNRPAAERQKVVRYRLEMSPTADRQAYILGTGDHYYDSSEIQDVEIQLMNGEGTLTRVTEFGGATDFAWSNSGQQIAYSDYDQDGNHQLYVASQDGQNRQQVTAYTGGAANPGNVVRQPLVGNISWSPDDTLIVFSRGFFSTDGDAQASLWVASLSDRSQVSVDLADYILVESPLVSDVHVIGWQQDSRIVAIRGMFDDGKGGSQRANLWVDTATGEVVDILHESDLASGEISWLVFPVRGIDVIGMLSGLGGATELVHYDRISGDFADILLNDPPEGLHVTIAPSPYDFPGESGCNR